MSERIETVRSFWRKALGTAGPHWMIMTALQRLDQGQGASGQVIADVLSANLTFVTSQSRVLERKGLVRREVVGEGSGATMLWLTEKARLLLAELSAREQET
jgi:DNA-binding MarR family transcriptional regulator